jgi:hypothetical protein
MDEATAPICLTHSFYGNFWAPVLPGVTKRDNSVKYYWKISSISRQASCLQRKTQVMLSSINTIADVETLYARLGERDYEAVMSYLADDIVWIVADNSPLADRSPYNGIGEVRSGIFERLTAGFDKLVFDADEIFECNGGEKVVALGYYYFRFHGQAEERKAQVAHVWTIRDRRAVKFQQYLDTLRVARDAGAL